MQDIDLNQYKNKKIAFVLSGGVVKAAAWHFGVALALEESGFTFKHNNSQESSLEISTYVGSSAGSLVGLYFASGYRPMDVIESFLRKSSSVLRPITYKDMLCLKKPMKKPPRATFYDPFEGLPLFAKHLLKPMNEISGLFTTQGIRDYMKEHVMLSESFDDYIADLFVVTTQLDHSRKVIFGKYNYPNPSHDSTAVYYTGTPVSDAVSASMSVPPFYSPWPIKNQKTNNIDYYIDGEIRETLSTHVAVDNKCDVIISSWTHTPYHFFDEVGSLINYGLPAICVQSIYLMIQKKIVSSRARKASAADLISTVHDYMRSNKFSNADIKNITSILETKLNYNPHIKFIDIYPSHDDYELFFTNSFSLNPKKAFKVVKKGYHRAMEALREANEQNV